MFVEEILFPHRKFNEGNTVEEEKNSLQQPVVIAKVVQLPTTRLSNKMYGAADYHLTTVHLSSQGNFYLALRSGHDESGGHYFL